MRLRSPPAGSWRADRRNGRTARWRSDLLVLSFGHAMIEQGAAADGECRRRQEDRGDRATQGHQTGPVTRTATLAGAALRMLKSLRGMRCSGRFQLGNLPLD